jgi:hypothetical protein
MDFFYRFRSTDALLGDRRELEKQEIYFAPPGQLNDPMEGFMDLFWQGDRIVWTNLIKNYLLSLQIAIMMGTLMGDDYTEDTFPIIVFASDTILPTPMAQATHRKICSLFFSDSEVATIPDLLAARGHPIRREELTFYLRGLHGRAMFCIIQVMRADGRLPSSSAAPSLPDAFSKAQPVTHTLLALKQKETDQDPEKEFSGRMFAISGQMFRQTELVNYLQASTAKERMWQMICAGYPERYVRRLNDLIYSDWYAACFVANHNQAAMWGNYGDSHKGVCLKFRATTSADGSAFLKLRRIVAWHSGPAGPSTSLGDAPHPFMKIRYVDKLVEVDFFHSIGRVLLGPLRKDWYADENGNVSACADAIFSNEDEWRKRYWQTFELTITSKLKDWEHEGEYRLILPSLLGGFDDPANRKLVYDFSGLAGVIFGINTPMDDRMNIVRIISEKCKAIGRTEFEFSQAYYSAEKGKIETHVLNLLSVV